MAKPFTPSLSSYVADAYKYNALPGGHSPRDEYPKYSPEEELFDKNDFREPVAKYHGSASDALIRALKGI